MTSVFQMAPLPTSLSVEIIRGCNLDCSMCLTERDNDKVRRMDPDLFRCILDQLRGLGLSWLRFCGDGEPTLHPQLCDYVALGRQSGVDTVGMITNGTRLGPDYVRRLFDSGLNFVAISVDAATEETYARIRRGRHRLVEVERNIDRLLEVRARWRWPIVVQLNFVVQPLNVGEVDAFSARWSERVDQVNLLRLTSQTASRAAEFGLFEPCCMLLRKLYVAVNGDIYPCFYLYPPIVPFGNVRESSIREMWARRRARVAEAPSAIFTPLCASCTYTNEHWCPGTPVLPVVMDHDEPVSNVRISRRRQHVDV